jgi:hypothetical protein
MIPADLGDEVQSDLSRDLLIQLLENLLKHATEYVPKLNLSLFLDDDRK